MNDKIKTKKKPLPFPIYFWTVIILAFGGIADSLYLSISHYRVYNDIAYKSFCAITRAINCDTVSQSPYAILWNVPVPVWGIFGYVVFLVMTLIAGSKSAEKKKVWPSLFILSLGFCLYSIMLAIISAYYIHSYCMMCIVSYAISFLLCYFSWMIFKRFGKQKMIAGIKEDGVFWWQNRKKSFALFSSFFVVMLILIFGYPKYWHFNPLQITLDLPTGMTEEGYPWIGAKQPELEIMEFTDYQCFQCKKMHFFLRRIVAQYPNKIRLIHRHFPMDDQINPVVKDKYHVGSGAMALIAEYATTQNKFWEMNDLLFSATDDHKDINIKILTDQIGLDYRAAALSIRNPALRYRIKHDISVGINLGITGTPGYVINGKIYLAQIPPEIFSAVLN